MADEKLLATLQDRRALLEAYAASSAWVMRRAFERVKDIQAFRGRKDLAPTLLEKLAGIGPPGDPVIVGAHLYALELTGARREIAKGVVHVLKGPGRKDPHLVGQLAGFASAVFMPRMGRETIALKVRRPGDLDEILKVAMREGEQP